MATVSATNVSTCYEGEMEVVERLKLLTMLALLIPLGFGLIALAVAVTVTWFSVFVYWRQMATVENLAKQMMDMAMSASLPDVILEKAAMYSPKSVSKMSTTTSTSSPSKETSKMTSPLCTIKSISKLPRKTVPEGKKNALASVQMKMSKG